MNDNVPFEYRVKEDFDFYKIDYRRPPVDFAKTAKFLVVSGTITHDHLIMICANRYPYRRILKICIDNGLEPIKKTG